MFAVVSPNKMQLSAGAVLRFPATWQDYRTLADQRGESSLPRLKYRNEEVLLMAPLPEHGRNADIIADVVKVLLESTQQEFDSFTPITMEFPEESGIEPDYCFYITNWRSVSGKKKIDWQQDPPPDLVIEIDVKSYTDIQDYLPYRVPEVWLFKRGQLSIYAFQASQYLLQTSSPFFPSFDVQSLITDCLQIAYQRNTSAAIRALRQRLA